MEAGNGETLRHEADESMRCALRGGEGPVSGETGARITAFITALREALEGAGDPARAEQ